MVTVSDSHHHKSPTAEFEPMQNLSSSFAE